MIPNELPRVHVFQLVIRKSQDPNTDVVNEET